MFTLQSGRKIRLAPATTRGEGGGQWAPEEEMASAGGLREGSRLRRAGSLRNDPKREICSLERTELREENKIKERADYCFYTD